MIIIFALNGVDCYTVCYYNYNSVCSHTPSLVSVPVSNIIQPALYMWPLFGNTMVNRQYGHVFNYIYTVTYCSKELKRTKEPISV